MLFKHKELHVRYHQSKVYVHYHIDITLFVYSEHKLDIVNLEVGTSVHSVEGLTEFGWKKDQNDCMMPIMMTQYAVVREIINELLPKRSQWDDNQWTAIMIVIEIGSLVQ